MTLDVDALLLGSHKLQVVYPDCRHPFSTDSSAIAILMDGRTFLFLEDDDDGYRSRLGCVMVAEGAQSDNGTRINRDVLVSKRAETVSPHAAKHDVYEFRDAITGKLGLSVGTIDIDDYYPSFVVEYDASAWNEPVYLKEADRQDD